MSEVTPIYNDMAVGKRAIYVVETESSKKINSLNTRTKTAGVTKIKPDLENANNSAKWMNWGTDNNFPAETWEKVRKSSLIKRIINDLGRLHYGAGIYYYTSTTIGSQKFKNHFTDKNIDVFLRNHKIKLQWANTVIRDYYTWLLSPVELVIDRINKKILRIKAHDASFVRFGDTKENGIIDRAFLSANFPDPGSNDYTELPVIDPFNAKESLDAAPSGKTNFIYPVMELTTLRKYYPEPAWISENTFNWLEVALYTPIHHKALLKNSITLKYIIYINKEYWPQKFAKWDDFTSVERDEKKEEVLKSIEDTLAGSSNAGKFIASGYVIDENGHEVKGLKIESIKDVINDKAWLMSSSMANSEIAYALGYDPSMFGHGVPGGKELSGSGSDKMRSLQNKQAMLASDRIVTLDPLNFISDYLEWNYKGDAIEWDYRDIVLSTLDENKNGILIEEEEENK